MNNFYIASYDLSGEDYLQHYGRKGMKWYQHIFGKEPNGRYTAKKRAKMVKKYGEKKTRLKEAQSVENAYDAARHRDKKGIYSKSDRKEYEDAISKIIDEGTWDMDLVMKVNELNKKTAELHNKYSVADNANYNYWVENGEKYDPKLKKKADDLLKELNESYIQTNELVKEWTNQVFGTTPSSVLTGGEYRDTGMKFISTLPQSFYDEYESLYNATIKAAEEKRKRYKYLEKKYSNDVKNGLEIDYNAYKNNPKERKRMDEAAEIGVRAVDNVRSYGIDYDNLNDNERRNERKWFLFEDQTIGMPIIADYINRGKSAKDVKELIEYVNEIGYDYDDESADGAEQSVRFGINEGYMYGKAGEEFADECEKVYKELKLKNRR